MTITVKDIRKLARIASDADCLARQLVDEGAQRLMATVGHGGEVATRVLEELNSSEHDYCVIACMLPDVYEQFCRWVPDQEDTG